MLAHLTEVFGNGDLSMAEDLHNIYASLINIIEKGEEELNARFLVDFNALS